MKTVTLQVPASTSNCGPGFDTLGIGLELYNFVRVTLLEGAEILHTGPEAVSDATMSMAREVAVTFAEATGLPAPGFSFDVWGEVPEARGLGSSATIRAGLLSALNRLHDTPLEATRLEGLAAQLDGAPDGIVACLRGGFCISRLDPERGGYTGSMRFSVGPDIAFVAISPEMQVLTQAQREVLPEVILFPDVVKSLNSLATVTAALVSGQYEHLRGSVTDFVHQPYRECLCPFTQEAIGAGVTAGAYCGWLSGSGSTVVCVAPEAVAPEVGRVMEEVFTRQGTAAQRHVLRCDNEGIREVAE